MPLTKSSSEAALKSNIKTLMGEVGKSPHVQSRDQALAVAYAIKRRGRAEGGAANDGDALMLPPQRPGIEGMVGRAGLEHFLDKHPSPALTAAYRVTRENRAAGGQSPTPWQVRSEARAMTHSGPISSIVPGRTDHHPMNVAAGSYVLPADHVSSLGQGNTASGMAVLNHMFGQAGPLGIGRAPGIKRGPGAPRPPGHIGKRAKGGATDEVGHPTPINAAGGEYVIDPEAVAHIGNGDVAKGHKILDDWVLANRRKHISTLKKLPGPAKS